MSDQSAEAFAAAVQNSEDDQAQIDALKARVDTLEATIEGMKNVQVEAAREGGLTDLEVVWVRTVIQKFHSSEQPPAPVPVA